MKNIVFSNYQYETRIELIASILNVMPKEDCGEHSVSFDNHFGKGIIRGVNFDHGVGVMLFDVEFNRDVTFEYRLGRRHPIQYIYCNGGEISLTAIESEINHTVQNNEAMIYAPRGDENYTIAFKKDVPTKCLLVNVIRFLYLRKISCDIETIPETLREMFQDTIGKKSFYFKSSSEPIIINILMDLFSSEQTGLERKLLVEANALKLITSLIKRYRVETIENNSLYRYSKSDLEKLNKAKNYIIDNMSERVEVKELAQMIVMNMNKLQKGFHMLFGKSIRQFTISLKLHYALYLLDQNEHSISEIAYLVGYTNKGHFSQLFKKEFGLLPSEYIKRLPPENS